ncbi:pectin lyase fold/virulence factor [Aspergillus pseudocaelatus]|uniref:pectinesterase n=1 Tax=Aspergillus pseudocaelatus TaxID=1825620 RepID=A0ABQ6WEV2_9EURO|nr:pectin lyase fold/virulence factor [Aspergillus pseudocaelatus]
MAIISWFFCIWICASSLAWGYPTEGDYSFPEACQASTPSDPLDGCPESTLLVSATHEQAHFSTIQGAIDSLPHDDTSQTILILSGTYTEQLNITRPGPLILLGESNSPHNASMNSVHVQWAAATEQGIYTDNVYTSVLIVAPTLNASLTGSGPEGLPVPDGTPFGCSDFRTYNIDFSNVYAERSAGPAHALSFSRANGGFYYSGFYSYQDTVFVGKLGNAYFHSSIVAGQTDFLYGFGTAWFERCDLVLRGCGGGITAWKGTNTTYVNKFGVYVHDSIIKAVNASVAVEQEGRCALGRPWNSGHRSIFAGTYEDGTIRDSGYVLWQAPITGQTLMGEYENLGPGWDVAARQEYNYSVLLDAETWDGYNSPAKVFLTEDGRPGNVDWIDQRIWWW